MSPFERMRLEYLHRPEEHSFDWYLRWHYLHGFVFSTPGYFVMGFAADRVKLAAGVAPMDAKDPGADCWFIFAAAGDLAEAWSCMPAEKPWLAWERDRDGRKDLQVVPTAQIRRLSGRGIDASMEAQR